MSSDFDINLAMSPSLFPNRPVTSLARSLRRRELGGSLRCSNSGAIDRRLLATSPMRALRRSKRDRLVRREAANSANGVGGVVGGAGRMVDAIPPASRGAALKGRQLVGELRMVDQVDQLRIHQRKQLAIQIALRLRRRLIGDAMLAELFHRPFAAVAVALDAVDAIALEQLCEFADRGFGRER